MKSKSELERIRSETYQTKILLLLIVVIICVGAYHYWNWRQNLLDETTKIKTQLNKQIWRMEVKSLEKLDEFLVKERERKESK